MEWMQEGCQARIVSRSVPPGGDSVDTGILREGQGFRFRIGVRGTWTFEDLINGGQVTLTVQ
jgi:hypothetical protein